MPILVDPNQERHTYYSTIRGKPWKSYFSSITSSHRKVKLKILIVIQNIIQRGDCPFVAGILAVIDLQSCLRSRLYRKGWKPFPPVLFCYLYMQIKPKLKSIDKYAILVKTKGYTIDGFEEWCAIKIQALFRGWKSRRSTYFLKSHMYNQLVLYIIF